MKNGGNPIASTSINTGKLQGQKPGPSSELWSLATQMLQGEVPGGFWPPCFGCGEWDELQENGTWNGALWCLLLDRKCSKVVKRLDIHLRSETFFLDNVKVSKVFVQSLWTVSQNHQEAKHIKSLFRSFRLEKNQHEITSFPFFWSKGFMTAAEIGHPSWVTRGKKVKNQKLQRDLFCRWKPQEMCSSCSCYGGFSWQGNPSHKIFQEKNTSWHHGMFHWKFFHQSFIFLNFKRDGN